MSDNYADPVVTIPGSGYGAYATGGGRGFDANALADLSLGSFSSASDDPPVLRGTDKWKVPYGGAADPRLRVETDSNRVATTERTKPLTGFNAEFFERWSDPNFQTWLTSRMTALGAKDVSTQSAYTFWVNSGEQTQKARGTQWTPEQYIEYMANGGRLRTVDEVNADIASGSALLGVDGQSLTPSPITTQTSVSTANMNAKAAAAAIDQIAQGVFGRMASKAEMKRFSGAINKMLRENPTVVTSTRDETNPNDVKVTNSEKAGLSPSDATQVMEMRMRRSSEGMAFGAGKMIEDALRMM